MKDWIYRVLRPLLLGALSLAAAAPVAMRVEVEPLGRAGDRTEVAVIIQIAPMDRGRIGSDAIVSIELDEGRVSSGSPRRAVRMGDDGGFRVIVEWPPGEHDLRVGIEDPSRDDTGLWVGRVRIPDLSPDATSEKPEESQPDPVPDPDPETPRLIEPQSAPASEAEEPSSPQPRAAESPPTDAVTPEPPAPTTAVEQEITDETESDPVPELPALVEPLRADPQPPATEPEVPVPSEPQAPPPAAAAPATAELRPRYEEWETAEANTREFSLIALRGRQPAEDLDPGELRLRIEGSEVPIERLGGPEVAPLLLGIAIDVMSDDPDVWAGSQGSLAPIAERAGDGRGRLFVANPSGVGQWDEEPETGAATQLNVARLVIASLERFEGQRGRTFLVVLTDGRNAPTKDEWQAATEAAGVAGVPILVVALWDQDFDKRTRKNLKKLAVVSGGSLFLVQGSSQVGSAADRFGRYLDGSYALRFSPPPGAAGKVSSISLSAADREVDITAPKTIR